MNLYDRPIMFSISSNKINTDQVSWRRGGGGGRSHPPMTNKNRNTVLHASSNFKGFATFAPPGSAI